MDPDINRKAEFWLQTRGYMPPPKEASGSGVGFLWVVFVLLAVAGFLYFDGRIDDLEKKIEKLEATQGNGHKPQHGDR